MPPLFHGHAQEVVARFKVMLPETALSAISDEHFDGLETLIEAAMSVMQSQAHNDFVQELSRLADHYGKQASRIEES